MTDEKLHPSVREFKAFMNRHPKLIHEVRKEGKGWQEYYEKWALLGEDDSFWDSYKEQTPKKGKSKQPELLGQIMKLTENVDFDKMQKQIEQLNGTVSTVQELVNQLKDVKSTNQSPGPPGRPPFGYFKD